MRFTVIGHSCLFVETSAGSIIVDPWLFGSCYWRSWWHYPPTPAPEPEWLAPDYVYLTHHHFDHFHFPSMRRIDRDAKVLVPRFGVDVLAGEVRSLGFAEVTELPHAQVLQLSPEVRVASYQYGTDDTVFVVADGSDVLVDVNDSKIRGHALRQVRDEFGRPTFVFKSYSFAQGYPACYTADDPDDLALITRESYLDDWMRVVEEVEPEFGVPFGSMVAFLHPESRHVNQFLVPPGEVVATWEQRHPASPTTAVQMDPGDRWSRERGFERGDVDWYADRRRRLDELAVEVQPKVDAQTAAEAGVTIDYPNFAGYFEEFLHAFPPGLLGRFALRRPVVFEVPSSPLPFWVIDFARRAVYRLSAPPPDAASVVRGERGGARGRDRQEARARRPRFDAHQGPREGGRRGRRHHLLGAARAVGAGLPAAAPRSRRAARRGGVATSQRMARMGRRVARQRLRLPLRAPERPVHHQHEAPPQRTGVKVGG